MLIVFALLSLFIAAVLFWQAHLKRRAIGIPGGRLIYSDTSQWRKPEEALFDSEYGLTGRPDYLIEDGSAIIPIEVKSSRPPAAPYDAHIFQLAAYCLLVEKVYGVRPPYGVLHYAGPSQTRRTFAIDFSSKLEQSLIDLLNEMHTQDKLEAVQRSHTSQAWCKACGYRSICDQRLG